MVGVKRILDSSDGRYLLNTVVLDEMVVWVQQASDLHWESLANEMAKVAVYKSDLRWQLVEMDEALLDDYRVAISGASS